MTSRIKSWVLKYLFGTSFALLSTYVMAISAPAYACGWWGDGEMIRHSQEILSAPNGKPLNTNLDLQTAKLPGRKGYGIAVLEPGQAVPYLQATYGRPLNRIGELKTFGFNTVIDLGASPDTTRKHGAESRATGMRYFAIPVHGNMPTPDQVKEFNQIVSDAKNGSVLVYAPQASGLGAMWAFHRFSLGAPISFAISQGRLLGLTLKQEAVLYRRAAAKRKMD